MENKSQQFARNEIYFSHNYHFTFAKSQEKRACRNQSVVKSTR